jgi:phage tail sheath gpL-like
VSRPDDAKTKFGQGSEAHLGAKAFFDEFPDGTLYVCPVAESAARARDGNADVRRHGDRQRRHSNLDHGVQIDVAITSGDTPTVMATNVATAIATLFPDLHVTAQFAARRDDHHGEAQGSARQQHHVPRVVGERHEARS